MSSQIRQRQGRRPSKSTMLSFFLPLVVASSAQSAFSLTDSSSSSSLHPLPPQPSSNSQQHAYFDSNTKIHATNHISSHPLRSTRKLEQHKQDERYEILSSPELFDRFQKLVQNYPTFATLTTAQEWFGLPRAGELVHQILE